MAEKHSAQQGSQKKENSRHRVIYLVLFLLLVLLFLLFILKQCTTQQPVNRPGETTQSTTRQVEISAEDISQEGSESKLSQSKGGGSVGLTYSNKVRVDKSSGKIMLDFQNPGRSNQDIALEIIVQGHSIAQSGRIQPGKQIKTLALKENISMGAGEYTGIFKLTFYDTSTGEQATVDTNINIFLTVVEQETVQTSTAPPKTSQSSTQSDSSEKTSAAPPETTVPPVESTTQPSTRGRWGCLR